MFHSNERIVKHKIGLVNLTEELGNVSKAYQLMSLPWPIFRRYEPAVAEGGGEALFQKSRPRPKLKNQTDKAPGVDTHSRRECDTSWSLPAFGDLMASAQAYGTQPHLT
jgi:hypothetical protein